MKWSGSFLRNALLSSNTTQRARALQVGLWALGICSRGQERKRHVRVCGVWRKSAVRLLPLYQFCGWREADINTRCMDFARSVVARASFGGLESISVLSKVVRSRLVLSCAWL